MGRAPFDPLGPAQRGPQGPNEPGKPLPTRQPFVRPPPPPGVNTGVVGRPANPPTGPTGIRNPPAQNPTGPLSDFFIPPPPPPPMFTGGGDDPSAVLPGTSSDGKGGSPLTPNAPGGIRPTGAPVTIPIKPPKDAPPPIDTGAGAGDYPGSGTAPPPLPSDTLDAARSDPAMIREAHTAFGHYPGIDDPGAPPPPIDPTGHNFNPFTGKWSNVTEGGY